MQSDHVRTRAHTQRAELQNTSSCWFSAQRSLPTQVQLTFKFTTLKPSCPAASCVCFVALQLKEHTRTDASPLLTQDRRSAFYLFFIFLLTFIFTLLDFSHITDLYGFARGVFSQTRHSSVSEVLVGQEGVFLVPTDPANSLMEMERTMWV